MLPPTWVKEDLHNFYQNVGRLSFLRKNIFQFSHVERFRYDNAPKEGTVTF